MFFPNFQKIKCWWKGAGMFSLSYCKSSFQLCKRQKFKREEEANHQDAHENIIKKTGAASGEGEEWKMTESGTQEAEGERAGEQSDRRIQRREPELRTRAGAGIRLLSNN